MIKALQKKFVAASMTAIAILLIILCVALNIANAFSEIHQNERILDMLSGKEFSVLWQMPPEFMKEDSSGILRPPVNENTRRSSIYFISYADNEGKIRFIDTSRNADITREGAFEISQKAVSENKLNGKIGNYRYKAFKTENNIGTAYVFLDVTNTRTAVLRVAFISSVVTVSCFALMLVIMILLSKRAIRPIAENMEKQKNFVTDAGHEIKTPLAIIKANTEALELHSGETKWTKNIKDQTDRLTTLTQDLISLARLDDTKDNKVFETISLSEITSDTVSMFYESAALKGVLINENIQPGINIKADREHIVRLISVLTDNAVKYCSEKSEISVSLSKKDKKIHLTVSNVCDSLPDCESEKLFDRFYRGDSSRSQKTRGYGIGLSAARTIIGLYKGKISAEYGENNKITFTVIL